MTWENATSFRHRAITRSDQPLSLVDRNFSGRLPPGHVTGDREALSERSVIDLSLPFPLPMHSASPSKKRHGVWNWFVDEETQIGRKSTQQGNKVKVCCCKCLEVRMELLRTRDDEADIERHDNERYEQSEWTPALHADIDAAGVEESHFCDYR
jgi:hypothetical protein